MARERERNWKWHYQPASERSFLHVLSLLTASKFLLIDLHACLHVPRHSPRTNTTTQQNFWLELHLKEQCHLFPQRVREDVHLISSLLKPGDLVLADRGLDIEDSVGLYPARLQIPSFTKGKPQLSALDIETTWSLANVRIHVERVIGTIRQKYAILGHSVIPIHYLMSELQLYAVPWQTVASL